MKTLVATLLALVLVAGALPAPAAAGGGSVNAALALGSFAVFNQMIGGVGIFGPPRWGYPAPVYYPTYYYAAPAYYYPGPAYPAPVYYSAPPANPAPPPPPAVSREVVYPHGRYVLQGDGITVAYQWTWIPNVAAAPLPAPPQGR